MPPAVPSLPSVGDVGLSFPVSTVAMYEADSNGAVHTEVTPWQLENPTDASASGRRFPSG